MISLTHIVIASLSLSAVSLVAGFLLMREKILTPSRASYFVGFAAGVMLTTAFLDLLPEALHESSDPSIYMFGLAGVIVFFLIERFVLWFHHHDAVHIKPSSYLILLGDGLHNFFDGLAIAAAFLTDFNLGVFTTVAIAAHEIPQEIADFTILIHGGMKKTKALFYNFLSALAALAGGLLGFYYLKAFETFVPLMLMFSAGVFIYIACSDLIPDLHQDFKKQKKWISTIPFLLGVLLTYILLTFIGESH